MELLGIQRIRSQKRLGSAVHDRRRQQHTSSTSVTILNNTIGRRVDAEDEIAGLDVSEHGLPSAYAGFAMLPDTIAEDAPVVVAGEVPVAEAVPVKKASSEEPRLVQAHQVEGLKKPEHTIVTRARERSANVGMPGAKT